MNENQHNELVRVVYRIEGRLEGFITSMERFGERQNKLEDQHKETANRVTSLEKGRAYLIGIATAVSTGVGLIFTYVRNFL